VPVFFILSGFVLTRTYAHTSWNRKSLSKFAVARLARIYPVYLISLILLSPFIVEMLLQPVWTGAQRAKLIADYTLVLQGWTGELRVGWNTPAWSLSCEFLFYLCFPALLIPMRKARWFGISCAMFVSIVMPIVLDHAGVPWKWKPIYDLPDFLAGIAAARIFALLAGSRFWLKRGYWLYMPALLVGGWLIIHPAVTDGTSADLGTYLRPANVALLLGFALSGGMLARALSIQVIQFLGKASYSMYILHIPILWWYGRYYVHGKLHPARPMAAVIYLVLVVAISGLVFHYLEAPASIWIRARHKKLTR
jgi:peptidoglycan/LPS O-acetylase OafA/YrhL